MGLVVEPIILEDGAWIGAFARIAPGVTVRSDSIVTFGGVLLTSTEPGGIYAGNPARRIKEREIRDAIPRRVIQLDPNL
jgi:putative colanic acid biosynthesis acetyltransferase WcaF